MVSEVFSITDAYESGYGDGLKKLQRINPWILDSDEYQAWTIGYGKGFGYANAKPDIHYYFISYRIIKASGSIRYHYAVTDMQPSEWVLNKVYECDQLNHYSVQYAEEVSKEFYDTNLNFFALED